MRDAITMTLYYCAGEKWCFRIRSHCIECDLAAEQLRRIVTANADLPLRVQAKPWLTHLCESLRHGGWRPPVALVDEKMMCQGRVSTRVQLIDAVRRALYTRGISPARRLPRLTIRRHHWNSLGSYRI